MNKKTLTVSVAFSVLIVFTSFPTIVADQTHQPSEIPELKEQIMNNIQGRGDNYPLKWSPGSIIELLRSFKSVGKLKLHQYKCLPLFLAGIKGS